MLRNRCMFAILTAALLAIPGSAAANSTNPTSTKVTSGRTSVSSCGSLSATAISWTVTADVVSSMSLTSIPAGCVGGSLSITLVNSSNTALGSVGPVTITGTSQTLTPSSSPAASSVATAYASVVGP